MTTTITTISIIYILSRVVFCRRRLERESAGRAFVRETRQRPSSVAPDPETGQRRGQRQQPGDVAGKRLLRPGGAAAAAAAGELQTATPRHRAEPAGEVFRPQRRAGPAEAAERRKLRRGQKLRRVHARAHARGRRGVQAEARGRSAADAVAEPVRHQGVAQGAVQGRQGEVPDAGKGARRGAAVRAQKVPGTAAQGERDARHQGGGPQRRRLVGEGRRFGRRE